MRFDLRQTGEWSYYYSPEVEEEGVVHGFFTKESPSPVLQGEERKRFLRAFSFKDAIVLRQEHGDTVHIVGNGDRPVSGDGLIIVERGLAGIIKTADCLPIIIADPGYPMVSIVHAGWRGTAKRIVQRAIRSMVGLGAKERRMVALLGPSINVCCYQVGEDVYREFQNAGFSEDVFSRSGGYFFLSLRRANREILEREKVGKIGDADTCTFCNAGTFYSFRRGERENRQINFVSLM